MAKRGGYPGGMIPGNMNQLMKQAQRMQRQMEEQQKELSEKEFTGTAGGGAVKASVSGKKELTKLEIDPEVCDPEDVETLEELVVLAVNDALRQADEAGGNLMKGLPGMGGLGL